MTGGPMPFVSCLLAPTPTPRSTPLPHEMNDCQNPSSQPMHADPSPEARDHAYTAADEYAEYSPAANTSATHGLQTPTITGAGTSADFSDDIEMYDNDGDNDNQRAESHETNTPVAAAMERVTQRFRSKCWKEFVPVLEEGLVTKGRCKHCHLLIGAGRVSGTSSMLTHLKGSTKFSFASLHEVAWDDMHM